MVQATLNYKLLDKLTEKALLSEKKEQINKYISEVAERCDKLCKKGENLSVLYEYKMMIDNLCVELKV